MRKHKIHNQLLVCLVFFAFVNAQVAPIAPALPSVTNAAMAILRGTNFTAGYDGVLLERGFADGLLGAHKWYAVNYPVVASNFDSALLAIRGLERQAKADSNYIARIETVLDKTQHLLDKNLARLKHAQTIGEVLLCVGILIGIGLVVAGILLATEIAKGMGIQLGATIPK